MFFKSLFKFGCLFAVAARKEEIDVSYTGHNANPPAYNFQYQTSYSGIVLTMKDDLIGQLKNTMLSAVIEADLMQNLLSNYMTINPT